MTCIKREKVSSLVSVWVVSSLLCLPKYEKPVFFHSSSSSGHSSGRTEGGGDDNHLMVLNEQHFLLYSPAGVLWCAAHQRQMMTDEIIHYTFIRRNVMTFVCSFSQWRMLWKRKKKRKMLLGVYLEFECILDDLLKICSVCFVRMKRSSTMIRRIRECSSLW